MIPPASSHDSALSRLTSSRQESSRQQFSNPRFISSANLKSSSVVPPASSHDSAISLATGGSTRIHSPTPQFLPTSSSTKPKSNVARTPNSPPTYPDPTPAEQAAAELEPSNTVQQAQDGIEVDLFDSVSDPGYETDTLGSPSMSLVSSVRDFTFENGRRYHRFREGAYNFPNDETEQEREDMKHAMVINLCEGRLHFAPIGENPQNILDMGTGTGIWAIEMGDRYPGANILGVDLSPIQPDWVPPSVKFMVDDVESTWLRPRDHFDYIHCRHTIMAFKDWPSLMQRVFDHLKPGGWFELQEIHHRPQCHDGSMPPDHAIVQYWDLITEGLGALGVDLDATLKLSDMMREAGFINTEIRIFHVPIGTWPKNKVLKMVGLYWRAILMEGLEPIALGPYIRGLKWSKEQVDDWLTEVKKAYMDTCVHSHMPLYIVCGQKPGPGVVTREG